MNKLLNKTLLYFAFFATALLLLSAPFFYRLMDRLYIEDVDEAILLRQQEFHRYHLPVLGNKDVATWNKFNRDIWILPDTVTGPVGQIRQAVFLDALDQEWEPYRVLYDRVAINRQPYIVRTRINLVGSGDLMKALAKLYLGILLVLFGVLLVLTRVMAKRLWQPFYETLNQIKNFNIEHQSLPVFADTAVTEFKQLNTGLSSLIQANLIAYQKQQEFIENAAHELQNPLAVFQSKLDLLVQEPTLLKGQVVIISSLYESASRLSRINKNLLLLAKLDNKHFIERQEVEAGEMLKEVLPNFTELAELKGLFLNMDLPVQPIWVQGHKGLLELMVNNLILNAIRHNIPAGNIGLKLTGKRFTIANTGEGVALSSALLYKRFAKTSFSTQGTGLGLAIVHQICQLHGWQITYQFTDQQHQFSVIF